VITPVKVILKNRSSHDTPVGDIMSSAGHDPPVFRRTDTVHHCMELITEGRFRHLPVVEAAGWSGCCRSATWSRAVIEDQSRQIEQLERYIAG